MIDYFAANDIAAFSVISGSPTETTGNIDTTYTSTGIFPSSGIVQSAPFMNPSTGATTSLTDLWFHCDFFTANNGGLNELIKFLDSSGTPVVRFVSTTNVTFRIDYWNGSAWVAGATTFNPGGVRLAIDIHIVCGLSGSLNVYFANNLQLTTTGLNAAVDNVQAFQLGGPANYTYSQILVSDTNTIGAKVAQLKPATLSAVNTAWSPNTVGNIVKTGFNDATFIADATLNDKVSYVANDATMPAGMFISSMWFAARARLNSSAPANVAPLLRIGSTNYTGAYNFGNLNSVSFGPSIAAYPTDPSTGLAWGLTNANAAEVGFITQT